MTCAVAFDIETSATDTGPGAALDPARSTVRLITTYGRTPTLGRVTGIFDIADYRDEVDLLTAFSRMLYSIGVDNPLLVGWNSGSFDLPYLAHRYVALDLRSSGPCLQGPDGRVGTHGEPSYAATWHGINTYDVAFDYARHAETTQIRWGLKPVAVSLGLEPVQLDASRLDDYTDEQVAAYGLSDAKATYQLYVLAHNLRSRV